jgi:glycosyltransferase involved in cell wall biosynthesis
MTRRVFVVVPSMTPSGPVKGAIALANGLVELGVEVTLVSVKDECEAGVLGLDPRAKQLGLGSYVSRSAKGAAYRAALKAAGGRAAVTSVSMCFSADRLNSGMDGVARIVASVRGNLFMNYRYDYGWRGIFFAMAHLLMLHRFDGIVAMSDNMARQLRRLGLCKVRVIPNFIDELTLGSTPPITRRTEPACGRLRLAFVGSLSPRKRPEVLVELASRYPVEVQLVGDGPMRSELEFRIAEGRLQHSVILHGQVSDPLPILRCSDYMVLPSESEGISRAVMESLFAGVPCIVRRVDANEDVVRDGDNGFLFATDAELFRLVGELVEGVRRIGGGGCLLPDTYRQRRNVEAFLRYCDPQLLV